MKKFFAAIAALAMAGLLMTGCSDSKTEQETTTASESVTETTTESEQETSEITEDTSASEENSETEEIASDEADEIDPFKPEFDTENVNPLQDVVLSAMGELSEWPALVEVTDEMILSDFFLLDKNNENYEQFIAMQCPMSAQICEIIIIKAADVEAAKADLEARQKKARDIDAFYPNDIERAAASIVGTSGDYAYFLFCDNPTDVETRLLEAIA